MILDVSEIKLVALDMDGTLTQHKTKLDEKNKMCCYIYVKNINV